jgi:hypothetical protein
MSQYNPTNSVPPVYVGVFGFSTTSFKLAAQAISTVFNPSTCCFPPPPPPPSSRSSVVCAHR